MIALTMMADNQDKVKQPDATSEVSQEDNQQASQKPETKKHRLKFKEEEMYKIKYDF